MLSASRWAFRLLLVAVLVVALWLVWRCRYDSAIRFLSQESPAQWIVYPNPPDILAHPVSASGTESVTVFRHAFTLARVPANALIELRAAESFGIGINGRIIVPPSKSPRTWKETTKLDATSLLRPGTNEIVVTVTNRSGPPLLWLKLVGGEVKLYSDSTWQASYADAVWQPAQLAGALRPIRPGNPMRSAVPLSTSLRRKAFTATTLLLLALVMTLLARRWITEPKQALTKSEITKLTLSGFILLWVVLFIHNVNQLSPMNGFDAANHIDYIKFIQEHHELPKAEQGWETHQPPLYYLFAATLLQIFQWDATTMEGVRALRYLSMLFGIGQIFLVVASLRLLFPSELTRPLIGTAMAAFLPAHLYHSHYVTNETFLALLVSGVFYLSLRLLRSELFNPWLCAGLGVCLGAALLTKLSALIVALVVLLALGTRLFAQRAHWRTWAGTVGIAVGACLFVCGWYYWGLWTSGGPWSQSRWAYGSHWWQEDGYRTTGYYLRFGESLLRPLYSGFHSFWDGIYSTLWGDGLCGGATSVDFRPPWDYDLVTLGYWLALLPTLVVLIGFVLAIRNVLRRAALEWLLFVGVALLFALALFYFSLVAPGASQVRASFGLMLLVPLCAIFALGFGSVASLRRPAGIALVTLTMFWSLNSFCAHWIPRSSAQPSFARARFLFERSYFEAAALEATEGLRRDPSNAILRSLLSDCWNQLGRTNEARQLVQQALVRWPDDSTSHLDAGFEHARAGRFNEAIAETRQAMKLAPDHPMAARQLVLLFTSQQRFGDAETACREALRITPHDPELHRWLQDLQKRKPISQSRAP
jgi:tetratricopeptide (TPR) repeat protein